MKERRRPATMRPVRAGAQALAVLSLAVLGMGGAAVAAPAGDQGPPEQAQGNGPPAEQPAPQANARARANVQARRSGQGHSESTAGTRATGQANAEQRSGGRAGGQGTTESGGTNRGAARSNAGKVTLCHATGSETNPYVGITVSRNAEAAHRRHQHEEDIIPATGDCPGGASQSAAGGQGNGKALGLLSGPAGGNGAAGENGVLGVSEERGEGPGAEEGQALGANQGGGDEAGAAEDTSGTPLPFTGLGLGLLAGLGALLALAGRHLRRRTA